MMKIKRRVAWWILSWYVTSRTIVDALKIQLNGERLRILVVGPHDDDPIIGMAGLLQHVRRLNAVVYYVVAADGSKGFCDGDPEAPSGELRISENRKEETRRALRLLGWSEDEIETNLEFLDYPDTRLGNHAGVYKEGSSWRGLQYEFTRIIRQCRPHMILLATETDLHPDHVDVARDLYISIFHSLGDIAWPGSGRKNDRMPVVVRYAVYCDFNGPATLVLRLPGEDFEKKVSAVHAFQTQRQIDALVARVTRDGPYEAYQVEPFRFYSVTRYAKSFFRWERFAARYRR